jgi:PIN domain nuclease of toxin-antitoxin system
MTKNTTRVERSSTFNRWSFWDYAIADITDKTNEFWFSVESTWGVGIRAAIAKLPLTEPSNCYILSRMEQVKVRSRVVWITNGNALSPVKKD